MTQDTVRTPRRIRRNIERVIREQRLRLMNREFALVSDIEAMYNRALTRIEREAFRIASRGTDSTMVRRAQLLSLVDDIQTQMLAIDSRSINRIEQTKRFALLQSAKDVKQMLEALNQSAHVNEIAASRAIAGVQPESPLMRLLARKTVDAGDAAREALVVGTVMGDNPKVVARDLMKSLMEPKWSAERIARTEVMRTYRGAVREKLGEIDVAQGWVWVAARDARTCAFCWAQHGTRHPLDVPMATHPNCRCSQAPSLGIDDDIVGNGPQSFARQPDALQLKVLGPAKYAAYKNGQLNLEDLVGSAEHPDWGRTGYEKSLKALGLDKTKLRALPRVVSAPRAAVAPRVQSNTPAPFDPATAHANTDTLGGMNKVDRVWKAGSVQPTLSGTRIPPMMNNTEVAEDLRARKAVAEETADLVKKQFDEWGLNPAYTGKMSWEKGKFYNAAMDSKNNMFINTDYMTNPFTTPERFVHTLVHEMTHTIGNGVIYKSASQQWLEEAATETFARSITRRMVETKTLRNLPKFDSYNEAVRALDAIAKTQGLTGEILATRLKTTIANKNLTWTERLNMVFKGWNPVQRNRVLEKLTPAVSSQTVTALEEYIAANKYSTPTKLFMQGGSY